MKDEQYTNMEETLDELFNENTEINAEEASETKAEEEIKDNQQETNEPEIEQEQNEQAEKNEEDEQPEKFEENENVDQSEVETQQSDDYFTHLLKLQAEFDNYRKRTEMEVSKAYKNGFTDAIVDFLPALDSFKMAKEYITDKNTLIGIDYIEKGILNTLEKMGVTVIDASGKFDPNFHQAIDTDTTADVESGYIVKECYKGFMMGDKVIRYSQVIVKK